MPTPPRILLIDDDLYQLGLLTRYLDAGKYQVSSARSVKETFSLIEEKNFDLVIMDVMMPDEGAFPSLQTHSGWLTGIPLAEAIRERFSQVKIIARTASPAIEIQDRFTRDQTVAYLSKQTSRKQLIRTIDRLLGRPMEPPRTFIVHGRDKLLYELKNYVQNTLRLGEPVVLAEQPAFGRTMIEKFEHYAAETDIAFVLMTPDDLGGLAGSPETPKQRPRQNVAFELGYFFGYLRRSTGRVILLHKGSMEWLSDLNGICSIDVTNGIGAGTDEIRRELGEWL